MTDPAPKLQTRVVPAEAEGLRLDQFLAEEHLIGGRRQAKELIQAGDVSVDGQPCKPGMVLEAKQYIEFRPPVIVADEVQPPEAWTEELAILYEDAWIMVIDKQAGLVSHRPERRMIPNVADLAERHSPGLTLAAGEDRPGIVHRLDRETSGVMVLAKTDEAMHFLKAQFKARSVEKEYRAIVYGEPRFESDWIEKAMAPNPKHGDRMIVVTEGGKPAVTFYELVERFDGFADLRCKPRTGRTHQIRVHLTSVGMSLVGDRVYRSRNQQQATPPEGAPDPGRHCLHAQRLTFEHPKTRERLTFEAPIPDDMSALLHWLRENRG